MMSRTNDPWNRRRLHNGSMRMAAYMVAFILFLFFTFVGQCNEEKTLKWKEVEDVTWGRHLSHNLKFSPANPDRIVLVYGGMYKIHAQFGFEYLSDRCPAVCQNRTTAQIKINGTKRVTAIATTAGTISLSSDLLIAQHSTINVALIGSSECFRLNTKEDITYLEIRLIRKHRPWNRFPIEIREVVSQPLTSNVDKNFNRRMV